MTAEASTIPHICSRPVAPSTPGNGTSSPLVVGAGVIRDVLSREVPGILYRSGDFYASAAAVGAAVAFLAVPRLGAIGLVVAAVITIAVRVGSRLAGLELPVPRRTVDET